MRVRKTGVDAVEVIKFRVNNKSLRISSNRPKLVIGVLHNVAMCFELLLIFTTCQCQPVPLTLETLSFDV